ncbi:unnamed protein product [Symbiodinium microadriaticum]|nr:unnamed protein product [Symbiodinium microadriaticum]
MPGGGPGRQLLPLLCLQTPLRSTLLMPSPFPRGPGLLGASARGQPRSAAYLQRRGAQPLRLLLRPRARHPARREARRCATGLARLLEGPRGRKRRADSEAEALASSPLRRSGHGCTPCPQVPSVPVCESAAQNAEVMGCQSMQPACATQVDFQRASGDTGDLAPEAARHQLIPAVLRGLRMAALSPLRGQRLHGLSKDSAPTTAARGAAERAAAFAFCDCSAEQEEKTPLFDSFSGEGSRGGWDRDPLPLTGSTAASEAGGP